MGHEIQTHWMGKMQFNAEINGHTIIMDATDRVGGEDKGPIPKPLLLSSLSGCTGMDVVALLRKKGKAIDKFDLVINAELSKKAPMVYTSIHIKYLFNGPEDSQQDAMEAVTDSQEKFCGVSHMLKQIMPLSWSVIYNDTEIFNNQATQVVSIEQIN
jgi:putative redox protein